MKTAFITGANKSIGFEVTRQLLQQGFYVYLGSRDMQRGREAAEQLKAEGFHNVEPVQVDVTSQESVDAARAAVGRKTQVLDVLINNAGVTGAEFTADGAFIPQTAAHTPASVYQTVYETNVYGVVRVTRAFLDLLQKSPEPRIVNVSSSQGSLTLHSDPAYKYYQVKGSVYLSSKSALNMYTVVLAYELRDTAFKVNAVCPGFTRTDLNHHRGTGTVEEAGRRIVKYALIGADGPTGKYFSEEVNPEAGEIPW